MTFPPGPKPNFASSVAARLRDPLAFYLRLARDYGDMCHFQSGRQHFYCLNHPDLIREVLVTQSRNFTKGVVLTAAQQIIGQGLLTSEGDRHRQQRRDAAPAFHRERIAAFAATMATLAARMRTTWQDGQTLDVSREMQQLTSTIMGMTLFGADLDGEFAALHAALHEISRRLDAMTLPGARWTQHLPLPSNHRYRLAVQRYRTLADRMIDSRRRAPEAGDLLWMLLQDQSAAHAGPAAVQSQLHDQILTFMLAGSLTIAPSLAWAWDLIARDPEVETQLHAEIDRELAGRLPAFDDLQRLTYTRMVVSEALRLFPPAWALGRRASEPCVIGGYPIPTGAIVLVSPYVMHRDPRYFPEPEQFDPQRWTPKAQAGRPKLSYFPFGSGARGCIGEPFAWMESIMVIVTLAQQWRLQALEPTRVKPKVAFLLRPARALRMRAMRRPV